MYVPHTSDTHNRVSKIQMKILNSSHANNIYSYQNIVTDLLSVLLSNGSVNKPQKRDYFYVARDGTVATQHRGKPPSKTVH
jgi:hypothetical protein